MRLDTVLEKLLDVVLEELQSVELEERRIQQITREAIQCCFVKDEAVALSFFEQTSHPSTQKVKARIALCAIPSNQDVERNLDLVNNERDAASHDESPEIPIISEPIEINNASIPWNRCTLFATGVVAVTAVGVAWYLNAKTDVIGLFQNVLSGRVSP